MTRLGAVLIGVVGGPLLGYFGYVQAVSYFGFWAGGMWLVLAVVPLAVYVAAKRQRALPDVFAFAIGAVVGFYPSALRETYGLSAIEAWFPTIMVAATAVCLGSVLVALRRKVQQRSGGAAA